jgi:hypothetical protein
MKPSIHVRSRAVTLAFASGMIAASCGSTDDDEGGIPLSELPAEYANVVCEVVNECLSGLSEIFFAGLDCAAHVQRQIEEDSFSALEAAVDAGRVEYRPRYLNACTDAIRELGCDQYSDRAPTPCEKLLEGQLEVGDACSIDEECSPGSFCDAQTSCPALCVELRPAGEPCSEDEDCRDGLICSSQIVPSRCTAPAGLGEACEGTAGPPCQFGLFCAGDAAGRTCVQPDQVFVAGAGQACDPEGASFCSFDLRCALVGVDGVSPDWDCVAPVGSGQACHPAFPDMCSDSEYCELPPLSLDGTCAALPESGEPCVTFDGATKRCAPGLGCDAVTCTPYQNLGGRCQTDDICYSGNCRDGACVRKDSCG